MPTRSAHSPAQVNYSCAYATLGIRRCPTLQPGKMHSKPPSSAYELSKSGLNNNHQHMRYDKALANGWPIATGMIEGACSFVIEDRFGITGARRAPTRAAGL